MGVPWLCKAAQGPQPTPTAKGLLLSIPDPQDGSDPRLPSPLCVSHQMPLITALNGSALNNSLNIYLYLECISTKSKSWFERACSVFLKLDCFPICEVSAHGGGSQSPL